MNTRAKPAVHVYCGPTITAAEVHSVIPDAIAHPPVRHGDLLRLDARPGDTVLIIDGVFHDVAAVRHKEILDLLARGVRVAGAASMGALRAAELHPYGMTGIGAIFAAYRCGAFEADDEVAVAHTPGDCRPLSEALADIRATATAAAWAGILDASEASQVVGHARAAHYTLRSWAALRHTAGDVGLRAALQRLATWQAARPHLGGTKRADAHQALHLAAAGKLPPPRTGSWATEPWRTFHLRHWIARYRGADVDGIHVPWLAVLQHQQLYDPGFPRRWRRHILSWVAGTLAPPLPADPADIEARALEAAAATGLDPRHLSAVQLAYWLTPGELGGDLSHAEMLARILVRSVPQDTAATVWPASADDAAGLLNPAIDSRRAAAAAFRTNDQIARSGPHRTVYELRADKVRAHLAACWHAGPHDEEPALTAAARDRGFHSIAGAVEAARAFFLSAANLTVFRGTAQGMISDDRPELA